MHLDEERVQRLLHGELEPAGEREARKHLASCGDCRTVVDEARVEERRIFGLLGEVDHPLPSIDPRVILATARSPRIRWERWAAGFLLVAAAGSAAYAAPGSPLPRMLDRLVTMLAHTQSRQRADTATTDTAAPGAGIAIVPGDRLAIRFEPERNSAFAILSLIEGDEVVVRALEGAATFSSDVERLSVRSAGPARFEIRIPRSAPSIEVLVGNTPVFRKRAGEVDTEVTPDGDGRYHLTLPPPTP